MKPAVIYTRVSTPGQVAKGVSLEAQLAKARAWCEMAGASILGEYSDAGISGKRTKNRPGLITALDMAVQSRAVVVVYSLSRVGRSTRDVLGIAERLDAAGADLVSLSEQIDTTTAAGKMVFRLLAVLSEFERDLIGERTRAALQYKRNEGSKTGGRVPYGYGARVSSIDKNGKKRWQLVVCPSEREVIDWVRDGRSQGRTYRDLCGELDRRGERPRAGKSWTPGALKKIIDRTEKYESALDKPSSK